MRKKSQDNDSEGRLRELKRSFNEIKTGLSIKKPAKIR